MTLNWEKTSIRLRGVKENVNPLTDAVTVTETAHILPFSLMTADTNKMVRCTGDAFLLVKQLTAIQLFEKCTIWSVLKSFTNIEFTELNGNSLNSLTNVFTLDTALHKFFGPLDFWFEAVDVRVSFSSFIYC